MNRSFTSPKQKNSAAFSIVEIIIVVTVISILAAITIVSYGQWRERVAETEVKSDLAGVQAAMEDYRNFNNKYPNNIAFGEEFDGVNNTKNLFVQSRGVDATYVWGDELKYCAEAASVSKPDIKFYIDSTYSNPQDGVCGEYVDEGDGVEPEEPEEPELPDPVSPPSGTLSMTVTVAGANAQGEATGGVCSAPATIERQIRHRSTSTTTPGEWSAYVTGSTRQVPANQGWQYSFQQRARCVDAGVSSEWVPSAVHSVVRGINAPSIPVVSVTPHDGSKIRWDWGNVGCPTGTTAQYRYAWYREGSESAWLGPTTGTAFTLTTGNQGFEFGANIQARCQSAFVTSGWSGSGTDTTVTPIATPGVLTNLQYSLSADRRTVSVTWTGPACGPGTRAEWSWNQFGYQPSTSTYGWNDGWGAYGFYSPAYPLTYGGTSYPSGYQVGFRAKYRCYNSTTGRVSPEGAVGGGTIYTIP